jgi:hypothetical protein
MKAMFEFVIRVLKWLPRPLVPFVPMAVTVLGFVSTFLLTLSSVPVPHAQEVASWSSKARNDNERPISAAVLKTSQSVE